MWQTELTVYIKADLDLELGLSLVPHAILLDGNSEISAQVLSEIGNLIC